MKEDIMKLLISGATPVEVAKVVTCTESYISQLMADPEFRSKVAEGRVAKQGKANLHDDNILSVEALALKRVRELVGFSTKPMEAAKVFQILNSAKLRGTKEEAAEGKRQVVVINLPNVVREKLITNNTNEVVQIGDRPLVTMNSQQLLKQAQEDSKLQQKVKELTHRDLPPSTLSNDITNGEKENVYIPIPVG